MKHLLYYDINNHKQAIPLGFDKIDKIAPRLFLLETKQFKHNATDHHKHEYVYKDFSFVPVVAIQDFRHLSLYVQLD